jgi:outer membrane protein assembly factor BamB
MARERLEELKKQYAAEIGRVAGRDVVLHEELSRRFEHKPPVYVSGGSDWPTFCGNVSRSLIPVAGGTPGARMYSVALGEGLVRPSSDPGRNLKALWDQAVASGMAITVMPAAEGGQLFFQDGRTLWGVLLESGMPLPGWVTTYGGSQAAYRLSMSAPGMNPAELMNNYGINPYQMARQHSVTVTDSAVLAVMGQPDLQARYAGARPNSNLGTRLVCLDRGTGRERWLAHPRDNPEDRENVKSLSFTGSPLVVGENVYVTARGGGAMTGEAVHVHCYDLATGKFRWASYIASSAATTVHYYGGMQRETVSHVAYSSGRLYCLTNIGAVAALDAYSGAIAWLNVYPRDLYNDPNSGGVMIHPLIRRSGAATADKPWEYNAPVVQDGRLFALPSDGKSLMVYDAGSGRQITRIELKDLDNAQTLLGVVSDRVVVASDTQVTCVNWDKWDPKAKQTGNPGYWRAQFNPIRGRGFVTSESVFVPTEVAMYVLGLKGGKVVRRFPDSDRRWADEEGPGNMVVTEDHVVIATGRALNVYTDLGKIEKKYLAAIAADPTNPELPLLHAEHMYTAGQLRKACTEMDRAIELLGGRTSMRAGAVRDRVFSDAITFAQKLAKDARTAEAATVVSDFFDRAGDAANTPSQHVNYRISRGRFIEQQGKPLTRAVELYQEVLSDPNMRIITLSADDGGGALQAGKVAENAINNLIRREGPAVYARYEEEAAAKLAQLRAAAQPLPLQVLADTYPNSKVAQSAMMLAADSYEKSGEPRLATQVLRRLYRNHANRFSDTEKARLHEAMARCYLRVGNREAALARLTTSASLEPEGPLSKPMVTFDGKPLAGATGEQPRTLRQAADLLAGLGRQAAGALLADMGIPGRPAPGERLAEPFDKGGKIVLPNVKSIAQTPRELPHRARFDRIIAWANARLTCLEPGKAQPLWTSNELSQPPTGLAWLDGPSVLVWGGSELVYLKEDGKLIWKADMKGLQSVELVGGGLMPSVETVAAKPGAGDPEMMARLMAEQQLVRFGRGMFVGGAAPAMPVADVQPAAGAPEAVHHVRPLTDRVLVSTTTGRLVALELKAGATLWQTRVGNRPIDHLCATDDFAAMRFIDGEATQLVVLDSFSGQQILRKGFGRQQGQAPVNIALSPDGMLIYTTNAQIAGIDLCEPGDAPKWQLSNQGHNYVNMTSPEQLLIHNGDQVLAVCDSGMFVDRRNVRDGSPVWPPARGQPSLLSTRASNDPSVRMRLYGHNLYIVGARSLVWYSLDQKADESPLTWTGRLDTTDAAIQGADTLIGRDYLLLPGTFVAADGSGKRYFLHAFSLAAVTTGGRTAQSGLLVYGRDRTEINEPAGITQWQAVQGGVCYVTADERLHMMRGHRKP